MKKAILGLLIALLMVSAGVTAPAEAPAAGSLSVEPLTVRRNTTWTSESYPEIWITPLYANGIIEQRENSPAAFLRFSPPEGASPYLFGSDEAGFLDHETLVSYSYYAYDRASFELFLEKAEPEHTLADGSDGVAMFIAPDNRRARSMISLADQFGGTSKLEIYIYDHTGDLSAEELAALIADETARVQAGMVLETLEQYWSGGVFSSVVLFDDYNDVSVRVDTSGMTLTSLKDNRLTSLRKAEERGTIDTKIEVGTYVNDKAVEATLADGTPCLIYTADYTGYAGFTLKDGDRPIYLYITINLPPEAFLEELERIYPLVTVLES